MPQFQFRNLPCSSIDGLVEGFSIGATKEKLDSLKTAQEQAKQQLENGDLGHDKYDALQREIIETEQELRRLQEEAAAAMEYMAMAGWKTEDMLGGIEGMPMSAKR